MTTKTPDKYTINGSISDELLTGYDEIAALTQEEASISNIKHTYQLFNKGISGKELDYTNLAHTLLEDEAGLNNLPIVGLNQSQEALRADSVDLPSNDKGADEYGTHLPQSNKWHPCSNMGPPSLEGQGYDQHRGSYYFINQSSTKTEPKITSQAGRHFDSAKVRRDFPILAREINGHPLTWLDNGATSQKPNQVIDAVSKFYQQTNSNVHRGAHELAGEATDMYEDARETVQKYINAAGPEEIIFLRGTTEAINLVANSYGRDHLKNGDEIILSEMEHHANIVPWQMVAQMTGAIIRVIPTTDSGELDMLAYANMLGPKTKIVGITHVSNVLGTINPVAEVCAMARAVGAVSLVDGAQSLPHFKVDVQTLSCDFFTFSGHKIFAPTGIGALYGRRDLLDSMSPWQGGGSMIKDVTFTQTTYADLPSKFEAGTGSLADAVGLGASLNYLNTLDLQAASIHESALLAMATDALMDIPGCSIIGQAPQKAGVLSFNIDGFSAHEIAEGLNASGIAIRSGHHCAQPILRRFGVEESARASFAIYNTHEDVERLITRLSQICSK
jgi:cysteine desulfurase/selenocysteine lyase